MTLTNNYKPQFKYWSLRALFCAPLSFALALLVGYTSIAAIIGMISGIAFFVAIYAWMTSSGFFKRKILGTLFGHAIHTGTWLRASISAFGLLALGASFYLPQSANALVRFLFWPDMASGVVSLGVAERVLGVNIVQMGHENDLASFIFTLFTTICQGLVLSATLFVVIIACYCYLTISTRISRAGSK